MKKMTREWIRKAEDDFHVAEIIAAQKEAFHDQVVFHCQQSAEKYCKALLEEIGTTIPKTHDLEDLLNLLLAHHASLKRYRRGLRMLTGYAVEPRYPLMNVTKRQATSALRWAGLIRDACRSLLGV